MEVNCEGRFMNPEDYRDFKAYWKDHKTEFKRLKTKNIIWRTIHRKNWLSMNGTFMWKSFLLHSSPIVPATLKGYIFYKDAVRTWNKFSSHMVTEVSKEIDKKILDEMLNTQVGSK